MVDKHGFPLAVNITTANVHDSVGIIPALKDLSASGFHGASLGDSSYQGKALADVGQDLGSDINPAWGKVKNYGARGSLANMAFKGYIKTHYGT